jgi:enamine deaminase RidA (YjgF/YER057c/UK114 family)
VVDWDPSKMEAIVAGMGAVVEQPGIDPVKPATLVGVTALFGPDYLVEIDAMAVLA